MEPLGRDLARFLRLLQSFQCQSLPCDLLIRACESRPTWSSTGEIIDRLPLEAGVTEWLVGFYHANKPLFHSTTLESFRKYIKYTTGIDGVAYLEMTGERQHEFQVVDEGDLARERIAIILQAFPSINVEIIGEEIIDRLLDVVKSSILPLLSSLTRTDIEAWLLPKAPEEIESFVVSMIELLYQVIDRLGVENPLIPLPFLRQLSSVIANQKLQNLSIVLSKISQILDAYEDNNALQSSSCVSGTRTDQRSNALTGHILAMILSNGASKGKSKALTESLAEVLSEWAPLSVSQPSTMEYLAATSFCNRMKINIIGKPSLETVDSIALQGLLLSRRKQHKDATEFLTSTIGVITSQYGPCSLQLGIVTAELANCYNILRQEEEAESCVRTTLHGREGHCVSTRRDGVYLRLALADSLIGRARYSEAVPVLEGIMDSPDISAEFRMMSALRLAKSRRRMHEDSQSAFEESSPLWICLTLLSHVPDVLIMEYVEELACNISGIPERQLENSKKTQELIEAVDSVLWKSRYLTGSPCWIWYTKVRRKYLEHIAKTSKASKAKEKSGESIIEDENGTGAPISPQASSRPAPQADVDISEEKGPWSEKLVLAFDGVGVRAFSSLLILKRIMHRIIVLEMAHPEGPAYSSKSSSWTGNTIKYLPKESDRFDDFLPCHFFDYVAGVSLGGLNSIMLGRLRMSVDQAMDSFIEFSNTVFGRSRLIRSRIGYIPLLNKYSAVNVKRALQNIIANNVALGENSGWEITADKATFQEKRGGIRTIAISLRETGGRMETHMWRSYGSDQHTSIWEVARATSASPGDSIKIHGARYWDGSLIGYNPSLAVLREVSNIHRKPPAVFVSIGTGTKVSTKISARVPLRSNIERQVRVQRNKDRELSRIRKLRRWIGNGTEEWRDRAKAMGLKNAYSLSADESLRSIPSDDWRPATTGEQTLQKITDITNEYLGTEKAKEIINHIAKEAVRIRRARARTQQWKDFI